ncbi:MAG: ferritin-like domain-containing protein [Anaerolinea sp.]|nr:ferritin-like domain-containing protein [Anaerolinea sp.]
MKMQNLNDLMLDTLKDTYDAEHQITKALPEMIAAVKSTQLKQAFTTHLRQTEEQIRTLDRIFEMLDQRPSRKKCDGMAGLIKEGQHIIEEGGDAEVLDAALIAAAQKVEHYEISAYGTLRVWAQTLGMTELAQMFDEQNRLEEETDQLLTQIAESRVNQKAK